MGMKDEEEEKRGYGRKGAIDGWAGGFALISEWLICVQMMWRYVEQLNLPLI